MNDLLASVLTVAAWLAVCAVVIPRFDRREQPILWLSFAAHIAAGAAAILVTELYYGGGDMLNYAASGRFAAARLRNDFNGVAPSLLLSMLQLDAPLPVPGFQVGSNTGSMQALSSLFMFGFGDSLYGTCVAIAGASFLSKVAVYRVLRDQLSEQARIGLAAACLLLPSAVFWSSGLLKEPIAVIGLGMMIYGGDHLTMKARYLSGTVWFAFGTLIVFLFKGYLLPPFGVGAGLWFLARAIEYRASGGIQVKGRYIVGSVLVAVLAVVGTGMALPQFSAETFAEEARAAQGIGARVSGGSNFSLGGGSLVSQMPLAIVTVLFRPFIFEVSNVMTLLTALEVLVLTSLVIITLFRRPLVHTFREFARQPALAFCTGFALTLAIGVGLNSTNLGTLSRYRMPMMPLYAAVLAVLSSRLAAGTALGTAQSPAGRPALPHPSI